MMSKKIRGPLLSIIAGVIVLLSLASCQDEFLLKPIGSDVTEEDIFTTAEEANKAIAQAYSVSMLSGIPGGSTWEGSYHQFRESTISQISGELLAIKMGWQDAFKIQHGGFSADDGNGRPLTEDGFNHNWQAIRHSYLVMEKIDQVADMSESEKEQVKAEMKVLIAYRYKEMLKRYGGVPIVEQSLSIEDEILIPRATVQETLDFIVKLSDEAAAVLPDSYPPQWIGRATRGVALATKAEALMYAARPLFNSGAPPMSLGGENDRFINFGNFEMARWQQAADASKAVLDWARANGHEIINDPGVDPLDNYGTAVATPGNRETFFAYKNQWGGGPVNDLYNPRASWQATDAMSCYQLSQYYKQDGTDQTWPAVGEGPLPYSDYFDKIQEMEARYKASAVAAGIDAWNNPGDEYWAFRNVLRSSGGVGGTQQREKCGMRSKFYYKAGTRSWFEFPLYRTAEFYLNLAEAYNELGQTAQALEHLNAIRDRAGLPDVTETDQDALRKIIQREWAIEFYEEGNRLFDVRHWKLEDIDNGIIGGPKIAFEFEYVSGTPSFPEDYEAYEMIVEYTGFWDDSQYFHPFPADEVAKGYLVQNPGY